MLAATRSGLAHELMLAVPLQMTDIYDVHQRVWEEVSRVQAVDHRPVILYRHDPGLIRVRITDCALSFRAARPVRVTLESGQMMVVRARVALWRSVPRHASCGKVLQRVHELLAGAGLGAHPGDIHVETSVVNGRKHKRGGCEIELPVVSLKAQVQVREPANAMAAWSGGMGRGRRFGFGMLDLQAT